MRLPWLQELLGHTDAAARTAAARLVGAASASLLRRPARESEVQQLIASLMRAGAGGTGSAGDGKAVEGSGSTKAGASAKLEEQEGCILAAGVGG
jgi:hypothetical protein